VTLRADPAILIEGLCFPEGPRWHRGELYVSDMHGKVVFAVDLRGTRRNVVPLPARPSGLGFGPDGRLRIVSMTDRKLLALGERGLETVADLSQLAGGHCNDMVLDASGRAYVGNFGFDFEGGGQPKPACLAIIEPDGTARVGATDLMFPNGCVITPDGRTLIVAETFARKLTAFRIDEHGSLHDRRTFAELPVFPDGISLDAEGCVWVASPTAPSGFVRVAEGGEIRDRIELGDRFGFACMLGGPERRTLFLLEAFSMRPEQSIPGNGRIRTVEVDVPGAGWPSASP